MNIIIITTKTIHHNIFLNLIKKKKNFINVIFETKKINFPFKTFHKIFSQRNKEERKFLIKLKRNNFPSKNFRDINSLKCINFIKKKKPKLILLFGSSKIKDPFLKIFKKSIIVNLHGGNPEEYRGLDSLMWTLYHNDFKNLQTTLHLVEKKLDTGKIVSKRKIIKNSNLNIKNLRLKNTLFCVKMVNNFLNRLNNNKKIKFIKQKKIGRYYSAFPSSLVDKCIQNLKR